ncbi:Dihydroorotate dehydrogenase electron transfer subunit [Thermodesulfovibrio sp. N1]|uniref:dihydroorotate dehydrogenase electron transfer subunit n=1 Tax=Thermodesulfovibrio sp. N1 TaxID=1871110 RepID=UPI00083A78D4|nr:dihydroorotate dehydrogenase electron transfer subunit [Thermodesulfovibrio sp. N1]ODA44580.1 Dihydroorotate dehydrogenase electron transfer subunit [Thermodesulfovibrio sp. N1]
MNKIFKAEILKNQALTEDVYCLSINVPFNIEAKPGQFFIIKINERFDPLLGRPFSIFDLEDKTLKFLYRVKGKGTSVLSKLREGQNLQITGPFGKWYPFPKDDYIVIAGGIGIASVFYLMKKFPKRAYLFYGARHRREIFYYKELEEVAKEVFISTECGTLDYKGVITELFRRKGLHLNLPIYSCGPMIMIRELKKLLKNKDVPCYVATEERMACGVGACLGCVIETKEGFKRVCTEGPVFEIGDLIL